MSSKENKGASSSTIAVVQDLKARMDYDVLPTIKRLETQGNTILERMDKFQFVNKAEYEEDKKTFVTHAELKAISDKFKPYEWAFKIIGTALVGGFVAAFIAFVVKGGLSR